MEEQGGGGASESRKSRDLTRDYYYGNLDKESKKKKNANFGFGGGGAEGGPTHEIYTEHFGPPNSAFSVRVEMLKDFSDFSPALGLSSES